MDMSYLRTFFMRSSFKNHTHIISVDYYLYFKRIPETIKLFFYYPNNFGVFLVPCQALLHPVSNQPSQSHFEGVFYLHCAEGKLSSVTGFKDRP